MPLTSLYEPRCRRRTLQVAGCCGAVRHKRWAQMLILGRAHFRANTVGGHDGGVALIWPPGRRSALLLRVPFLFLPFDGLRFRFLLLFRYFYRLRPGWLWFFGIFSAHSFHSLHRQARGCSPSWARVSPHSWVPVVNSYFSGRFSLSFSHLAVTFLSSFACFLRRMRGSRFSSLPPLPHFVTVVNSLLALSAFDTCIGRNDLTLRGYYVMTERATPHEAALKEN
jgi:hypothetical protein